MLYVFGDAAVNLQTRAQLDSLDKHVRECAERDMKIIVPGSCKDNPDMYSLFRIMGSEFSVVLVGKDGTEKFRSHHPVGVTELFRLIDSMPMRQLEMKKKLKE